MLLINRLDCPPHLLAQHSPVSVGQRLLEADHLDHLYAAIDFDKLRIGLVSLSCQSAQGPRRSVCMLCHSLNHGLSHLLGECVVVHVARVGFLNEIDEQWAAQLKAAPAGDWPVVVLNPHQLISRLVASVNFVSQVVKLLHR